TNSGYHSLPDLAVSDVTGDGRPDIVTIEDIFGTMIGTGHALVATNDGDWNPPLSIVISDAAMVVEGNSGAVNAVFTISIVGAHSGNLTVDYSTGDGTAIAGADYLTTSGTLTFGPGDSTQKIFVAVKGDTSDEYDEQFTMNLSNAVGGVIADSQGFGTIQDDDAPPLVTINDISANEGNRSTTSLSFTVSLGAG